MKGEGGFVRDYRSTIDWEWFTDVNTAHLWEYIRLRVNYEPSRFRGIEIRRGEMLESIPTMALNTGLSQRKVRTALKHLKSTGEVTCKATRYGMLIYAVKYAFFQGGNDAGDMQSKGKPAPEVTQKRHGSDTEVTTYKEYKESKKEKEIKKEVVGAKAPSPPPTPEMVQEYADSIGYEIDAGYFCDYYGERGWIRKDGTPIADWKATIRNWQRKDKKKGETEKKNDIDEQYSEYLEPSGCSRHADWMDE